MMQPSGIASALPGQGAAGMAPGQAMPGQLPFNVPKSSGIDPANITARLKGMPLGQLSALFAQAQQSRDPMVQAQLLPIAAALSDAAKAAQMQQAGAGQAAMQQAAQMQQQPPIVEQIAQQAAQSQQPEQGYAGGGLTTTLPYWREGQRFGIDFSPYDSEEERNEKKARLEQMLAFEKSMRENRAEIPVDPNLVAPPAVGEQPETPLPYRGSRAGTPQPVGLSSVTPRPTPRSSAPSAPTTPPPYRGERMGTPMPPTAAAQSMQPTQPAEAGLPSAVEQMYDKYVSGLESRKKPSQGVEDARKGLDALMRQRIAEEEQYAKDYRSEAEKARDEALKETQGFTPRLLAAMGAGISTRKGEVMGSLLGGLSKGLEQQAVEAKEAKKDFRAAQHEERKLLATLGQMRVLEEQRKLAVLEGDDKRVSDIDDKLFTHAIDLQKYKDTRADEATKLELARSKEKREQTTVDSEVALRKAQAGYYGANAKALLEKPATSGDKQRLAELKTLQQNLQKQLETAYGSARAQIQAQLDKVNASIAVMSGITLPGAATAAPPIGTVMQGYRFKGGDPADKNNWEKV